MGQSGWRCQPDCPKPQDKASYFTNNMVKRLGTLLMNLPASWRWCLPAWALSRVMLGVWGLAMQAVGLRPFSDRSTYYFGIEPYPGALLEIWQRWDGINYQRIVENGYASQDVTAFFPLYPLLARGLRALTGLDSLAALVTVSSGCFLLALVLLYRLAEEAYGAPTARGAVAAAALFPTAFFFHAPYPQSLALLLALAAALWARQGRWLATAGAGLLSGLTHSTGAPLALLLAWEAWEDIRAGERRGGRAWLAGLGRLAAAGAPLLGVALFLSWRMHMGFPDYAAMLAVMWQRVFQWPWQAVLEITEVFTYGWIDTSGWCDLLLLGAAAATVGLGWRRLRTSHWLYAALMLVMMLSTGAETNPIIGFGRYVLGMFPVFLLLPGWARPGWRRLGTVALAFTSQLLLSGMYFLWLWVD